MVLIPSQWMLIDGSWFYLQKNIDFDSRRPGNISSSLVELPSAGFVPPAFEDQALTAID